MQDSFAILFVDGSGEWDVHGANFDAVLSIATVGDAVLFHNRLDALVSVHDARRMHVEEPHLGNCLRANVVIAFVLRTRFETTPAGHAT